VGQMVRSAVSNKKIENVRKLTFDVKTGNKVLAIEITGYYSDSLYYFWLIEN